MSISIELQTRVYETLKADPDVAALVSDRIYDGPPVDGQFPQITFGPTDTTPQNMECIAGRTETFQIDVWSRDEGTLRPCREIMDAVKSALHLADLALTTNALVLIEVQGMRAFLDRDGLTAHGVVTVEADLEEA